MRVTRLLAIRSIEGIRLVVKVRIRRPLPRLVGAPLERVPHEITAALAELHIDHPTGAMPCRGIDLGQRKTLGEATAQLAARLGLARLAGFQLAFELARHDGTLARVHVGFEPAHVGGTTNFKALVAGGRIALPHGGRRLAGEAEGPVGGTINDDGINQPMVAAKRMKLFGWLTAGRTGRRGRIHGQRSQDFGRMPDCAFDVDQRHAG